MTIVADRRSIASGTTNKPEPPPELPSVDDAQQFYLEGSYAASTIMRHNVVQGVVCYVDPEPGGLAWVLERVASELSRLVQLRPGWDGRHGKPVTQEAVYGTARVLINLLDRNSQVPQFFPLPDGGIQVEWYGDHEIEIDVDGSGEAYVIATSKGEVVAEGVLEQAGPSDLAAAISVLLKELSTQSSGRHRT
jgi:hypothetical protein